MFTFGLKLEKGVGEGEGPGPAAYLRNYSSVFRPSTVFGSGRDDLYDSH